MTDTEAPLDGNEPIDQPSQEPTLDAAALKAELDKQVAKNERLRKDLDKFRTRADEVTAAQKAAEEKALAEKSLAEQVEALKAQLAEKDKAAAEAAEKALMAERRASLTGKVADATAALKLLDPDKHLTEDGQVNVEALLADYSFLATKPQTVGASSKAPQATSGAPQSLDDFVGKPQSYYDKYYDAFVAKHSSNR